MKKSYKFRIYPNNKQKRLIEKTFVCCRFIYNYFLDKRIKLYEIDKQSISGYDMIREITQLKKQYLWLKGTVRVCEGEIFDDFSRHPEAQIREILKFL